MAERTENLPTGVPDADDVLHVVVDGNSRQVTPPQLTQAGLPLGTSGQVLGTNGTTWSAVDAETRTLAGNRGISLSTTPTTITINGERFNASYESSNATGIYGTAHVFGANNVASRTLTLPEPTDDDVGRQIHVNAASLTTGLTVTVALNQQSDQIAGIGGNDTLNPGEAATYMVLDAGEWFRVADSNVDYPSPGETNRLASPGATGETLVANPGNTNEDLNTKKVIGADGIGLSSNDDSVTFTARLNVQPRRENTTGVLGTAYIFDGDTIGSPTFTLPAAVAADAGRMLRVDTQGLPASRTITIARTGSDTILGLAGDDTLTPGEARLFMVVEAGVWTRLSGSFATPAAGEVNVLGNAAEGISGVLTLVATPSKDGTSLMVKGLQAGTGVTLTNQNDRIVIAASGGGGGGGTLTQVDPSDADLTATLERAYVWGTTMAADRTITLPAATTANRGMRVRVIATRIPSARRVFISPNGTDTIAGITGGGDDVVQANTAATYTIIGQGLWSRESDATQELIPDLAEYTGNPVNSTLNLNVQSAWDLARNTIMRVNTGQSVRPSIFFPGGSVAVQTGDVLVVVNQGSHLCDPRPSPGRPMIVGGTSVSTYQLASGQQIRFVFENGAWRSPGPTAAVGSGSGVGGASGAAASAGEVPNLYTDDVTFGTLAQLAVNTQGATMQIGQLINFGADLNHRSATLCTGTSPAEGVCLGLTQDDEVGRFGLEGQVRNSRLPAAGGAPHAQGTGIYYAEGTGQLTFSSSGTHQVGEILSSEYRFEQSGLVRSGSVDGNNATAVGNDLNGTVIFEGVGGHTYLLPLIGEGASLNGDVADGEGYIFVIQGGSTLAIRPAVGNTISFNGPGTHTVYTNATALALTSSVETEAIFIERSGDDWLYNTINADVLLNSFTFSREKLIRGVTSAFLLQVQGEARSAVSYPAQTITQASSSLSNGGRVYRFDPQDDDQQATFNSASALVSGAEATAEIICENISDSRWVRLNLGVGNGTRFGGVRASQLPSLVADRYWLAPGESRAFRVYRPTSGPGTITPVGEPSNATRGLSDLGSTNGYTGASNGLFGAQTGFGVAAFFTVREASTATRNLFANRGASNGWLLNLNANGLATFSTVNVGGATPEIASDFNGKRIIPGDTVIVYAQLETDGEGYNGRIFLNGGVGEFNETMSEPPADPLPATNANFAPATGAPRIGAASAFGESLEAQGLDMIGVAYRPGNLTAAQVNEWTMACLEAGTMVENGLSDWVLYSCREQGGAPASLAPSAVGPTMTRAGTVGTATRRPRLFT